MCSYQYNAGVAFSVPFGSILGVRRVQPTCGIILGLFAINKNVSRTYFARKSDVVAVVPVNVVFSNYNVAPARCLAYTLPRVS